jgi:hypothetical protein
MATSSDESGDGEGGEVQLEEEEELEQEEELQDLRLQGAVAARPAPEA